MFIISLSPLTHDCTYDDSENDVTSILAFSHKRSAQLTKKDDPCCRWSLSFLYSLDNKRCSPWQLFGQRCAKRECVN